jgi:POT family proton-dependent oligopeptide transporter
MPRQIPYIIGNEGCERFSFYGMRNILTIFLAAAMLLEPARGRIVPSAKPRTSSTSS